MEAGKVLEELVRECPALQAPLERFAQEVAQIGREAWHVDEIEDRLVAAQRGLMQELMQTLVAERGRQAEQQALLQANTKRHRKKS